MPLPWFRYDRHNPNPGPEVERVEIGPYEAGGSAVFMDIVHESSLSTVQRAEIHGTERYWRDDRAKVVKRSWARSARRAELQGQAFAYIQRLEDEGHLPRLLSPILTMSRLSDQQRWDFYPWLPATLASANDADGDAAAFGYDANDVIDVIREFASLAHEIALFHEATGLVHRDIKPSNIGLINRGLSWSLILFDLDEVSYGVQNPDDTQHEFTNLVDPGGAWTPPEITFLNRHQGARVPFQSDVWGLAAVIYWCVTQGALPFGPRGADDHLERLYLGTPDTNDLLHPALHRVLSEALRRDPWRRPTMRTFAENLRGWLTQVLHERSAKIIAQARRAPTAAESAALRAAWQRIEMLAHVDLEETLFVELNEYAESVELEKSNRQQKAHYAALGLRLVDSQSNAALAIAHIAHRLGVSFADAVELIEAADDDWKIAPSDEMVPRLLRDIVPVLEQKFHVLVSPDGQIAYHPIQSQRPESDETIPKTKVMPPDIVDTELLP